MVLIGCGSSKPQATIDASTIVPEVVKEEKAPNPEGLRHFMEGQLRSVIGIWGNQNYPKNI
jgi:hypothetical protein